jgi:hypothetical protein
MPIEHQIKAHELWLVGGVPSSPSGMVREGQSIFERDKDAWQ